MTPRTHAALRGESLAALAERGAGATLMLCLAGLLAATVGFVANSL